MRILPYLSTINNQNQPFRDREGLFCCYVRDGFARMRQGLSGCKCPPDTQEFPYIQFCYLLIFSLHDRNELHRFHATKAFNSYVDQLVTEIRIGIYPTGTAN